jgi:hypothetical protein
MGRGFDACQPWVKQTKQNSLAGEVLLLQVPNRLHCSVNDRGRELTVDKTTGSPNDSSAALVACGLWLHIGLIGATALAAGLLQCFADPRLPWAPAVALFGGVLAVASWRRGFAVLEQAERGTSVAKDGSSDSSLRNPLSDQLRPEAPAVPFSASIEPQGR